MSKVVDLLKKAWADEPVIVSTVVGLAVSEGVLTSSQASTVTDVAAAVVALVAAFIARSKVSPAP